MMIPPLTPPSPSPDDATQNLINQLAASQQATNERLLSVFTTLAKVSGQIDSLNNSVRQLAENDHALVASIATPKEVEVPVDIFDQITNDQLTELISKGFAEYWEDDEDLDGTAAAERIITRMLNIANQNQQ